MKTLTLEQVRKAMRFAWHQDGWIFADGQFICLLLATEDHPLPSLSIAYAEAASETEGPHGSGPQSGGWHHLDGCDCEFCRA